MGGPAPTTDRVWLVGLFFGSGASPTGALIESLAVALARRGYSVEVLAGTSGYSTGGKSVASRFHGPVYHLYSGSGHATRLVGRLVSWVCFYLATVAFIFTRPLPRVVILTTTPPLLHAALVFRKLVTRSRCQLVLWNQDTYPEILGAVGLLRPRGVAYRVLSLIERWAVSRVDHVVALDRAMAAILRSHGARTVRIIPNWEIDRGPPPSLEARDPLDEVLATARRHHRLVLLYSGNYGWGHDLAPLLAWFRRQPDQSAFYLICVGGGEKWADLRAFAQEVGERHVTIDAYLPGDRYHRLLQLVDWGVVTLESRCAGLMAPSKIHAYLAAGKPLVYFGPPGSNVDDAIRTFDCGVRIDLDDPTAAAGALAGLVEPGTDYERLSAGAARAARERHSEEAADAAFGALMDDICRTR